ncbi:iron uptake system protein EfeO [Brevibacillus laterosporus]|uniref:iron uptake system protein EfeO n=1 Tax=Brevibacillus laterosporus TaxID=1465 RepID=UPI000EB54AC3|nr:iron uptake system protein EfeO [Brevibacillus laterosporus]AYK07061.1 EfeM/EfeO family lipoprotein [Brevibacillus laterosporus]MDF9411151.1 EfeM/EfeO family lipoprotein [Brevibacillus laterosporus]
MKKSIFTLSTIFVVGASLLGCTQQSQPTQADNKVAQTDAAQKVEEKKDAKDTLKGVTEAYRTYSIDQIDQFVVSTEKFVTAVKTGDMETAKKLYAPSRMYYERIEPIAESLGDLDPKIDARDGDVPKEEWGGFHKIEQGLWANKTTKGSEKVADQLLNDAKLLRAKVETVEVTPELLVTGAVDLLNEVSSSKVTGEEERYSHTDLYDFAANVEGAQKIYELLQPALVAKDQKLSDEIKKRFGDVFGLLAPFKKGEDYASYTELKPDQVKKLSQAIDALAEPLSKIGVVLEG